VRERRRSRQYGRNDEWDGTTMNMSTTGRYRSTQGNVPLPSLPFPTCVLTFLLHPHHYPSSFSSITRSPIYTARIYSAQDLFHLPRLPHSTSNRQPSLDAYRVSTTHSTWQRCSRFTSTSLGVKPYSDKVHAHLWRMIGAVKLPRAWDLVGTIPG
jgi:hypothetical protein